MPSPASFEDILIQELKNLHNAETRLLKILPTLVGAASNERLKAGLENLVGDTRRHLARLCQAAECLRASPRGKACHAMTALAADCLAVAQSEGAANIKDARLALAVQRTGHYKICGYESARTLARALAFDEVADLLLETLVEEAAADGMLDDVAVSLYTDSDIWQIEPPASLLANAS